jgi:hypothetical protein
LEPVVGDIGALTARHLIILKISLCRQQPSKPFVAPRFGKVGRQIRN